MQPKKEACAFLCFILKCKILCSLSCLPLLCLRLQTDADATQESKELKSSELCSRPTCIFPSLWLQKENYPTQQIVLPNINKYGNNIFLGFINFIKTQLSLNISRSLSLSERSVIDFYIGSSCPERTKLHLGNFINNLGLPALQCCRFIL